MSENLRKKSGKKVAVIVSAMLALVLFCGGVGYAIAQMSAQPNIGGSITFSAQNIYATISAGTVSGNSSSDSVTGKMTKLDYTANSSSDVDASSWSGLALTFDEDANDVVISFTITNNSKENDLKVTVTELAGTSKNASMKLAIDGEEKQKDGIATLNKVGSESDTGTPITVTITFSVTDKNESAQISNFSFALKLENVIGA